MALPSGVTRTDRTPEASLPAVGPGATGARLARDGSRWCATCDTTLRAGSRETYCTECKRSRNTAGVRATRERERRAAEPVGLTFSSNAIEGLFRANSVLQRKMAVASGKNQPASKQPDWLDELLLASKSLAVSVADLERQWRDQRPT